MTAFANMDYHGTELRLVAHAELRRCLALPVFGGKRGRLATRPPKLVVSDHDRNPGFHGEADWNTNTITVNVYPEIMPADLCETILHELTHLCREECWHHRADFKRTLAQAAYEAWGVDCREGAARRKTTDLDYAIVEALSAQSGASWWRWMYGTIREVWGEMAAVPTVVTGRIGPKRDPQPWRELRRLWPARRTP